MADLRLPYSKPTSSLGDLLRHWESQGLLVTDRNMAEHHLRFIGYYRLRGYAHHFQQIATNATGVRLHQFRRGSTFENIFDLYCLDRGLRSSLTAMLERIEVGVRTVISEKASIAYGPHWFLSKIAFADDAHHQATDQIFRKILNERESARRHNFLAHYRKTYSTPEIPPSWMMFELLSFGNISHIYAGLSSRLKKDIAANFDISPETLTSWIWALSCLRNLCAHHCRIWNRSFTVKPKQDKKLRPYSVESTESLYIFVVIIHYFLVRIHGAPEWIECLRRVVGVRTSLEQATMGFPKDWERLAAWSPASR